MGHDHNATAGGILVSAMWSYAASVLRPAQAMKRAGVTVTLPLVGEMPEKIQRLGLGPKFSRLYKSPVVLNRKTEHDHLVEEFDEMSEVYSEFVQPFSRPIFEEATQLMSEYLTPDARVLDAGCGPGRELQRIARKVPEGEVVGIDLSQGMVKSAHRSARAHGLRNCAFVQSDVGDLPENFAGEFDVVYSCLAHHHYPEPPQATCEIIRVLRPGGIYCVVDPGPEWYNKMSTPLAKWADPGWIGFHTPKEFCALFRTAGFARVGWMELLPGFGAALGQKPIHDK
ncbi:MAG TPA: class I SAM-dependent methyltransferase [Candidatus Eisenbacteria bacterium]|nr:class I SAM-dependent methyltransferase [Candidatus Eisenbacteria bacterium]